LSFVFCLLFFGYASAGSNAAAFAGKAINILAYDSEEEWKPNAIAFVLDIAFWGAGKYLLKSSHFVKPWPQYRWYGPTIRFENFKLVHGKLAKNLYMYKFMGGMSTINSSIDIGVGLAF
jgi:hypothetical protein